MLPLRTILHPTDFSENAHYAFRLACSLARDYGARLVIVHVAPPQVMLYTEGIVPPRQQESHQVLQEKLQRLHPAPHQTTVEHRLVLGDPATELLVAAEETKCDVIVMGTHGHRGLTRLLMGSVAEQIIRRASCPVVTVKMPLPEHRLADDSASAPASQEAEATRG